MPGSIETYDDKTFVFSEYASTKTRYFLERNVIQNKITLCLFDNQIHPYDGIYYKSTSNQFKPNEFLIINDMKVFQIVRAPNFEGTDSYEVNQLDNEGLQLLTSKKNPGRLFLKLGDSYSNSIYIKAYGVQQNIQDESTEYISKKNLENELKKYIGNNIDLLNEAFGSLDDLSDYNNVDGD
jgi:hypothetical protein